MSYVPDKLKMGWILTLKLNLTLKIKVNCPPPPPPKKKKKKKKTIGTLTKVFCIFGPNLAILAWTGPELSRGQASDWHTDRQTHTHTDAGNDNTRRPKLASGKN